MLYTTDIGVHKEVIECSSLSEAYTMLENASNTFYDDYDLSYHVEEHLVECPC
jgi:hypothetical protein